MKLLACMVFISTTAFAQAKFKMIVPDHVTVTSASGHFHYYREGNLNKAIRAEKMPARRTKARVIHPEDGGYRSLPGLPGSTVVARYPQSEIPVPTEIPVHDNVMEYKEPALLGVGEPQDIQQVLTIEEIRQRE